VSALYAWLARHPRLVDGTLAFALAILGLPTILLGGASVVLALVALVMIIAVVFRRRNPAAAFALAVAAGAVQVLTASRPIGTDLAVPVLLYTLAAYQPRRHSLTGLAICLAGSIMGVLIWAHGIGIARKIFAALVIFGGTALVAWVLGDSMHYRRAYYLSLEERAARAEAERDAQATIAAAAERARIARELHDVVAHNVSVMVVQADGAGYALDRDPERARGALMAISRTGRQALAEMRRLLGVLRSGDEQTGLAPQPGLAQLRELISAARTAGMSVSLTTEGEPVALPEGAELAAYRVVQESLTNTRKHAGLGASAAILLRFAPDELLVRVIDDGLGGPAADVAVGHGLIGMRERVEMYGGTVQAGPRQDGGYQVSARLPLDPVRLEVTARQGRLGGAA
jgi:signal transduction histidine kinase